MADVLSGAYNPAGRLPVTFYKSVAQLPPFTDYSMANRTYRYLTEQPLYPFGYGLSYATFSYSTPGATAGLAAYAKTIASAEGADGRYHPIPDSQLVKNRQASSNTPDVSPSDPSAPEARHFPSTATPTTTFPGDSPITVTTRVTNTSKLPGDEVVELYISPPRHRRRPPPRPGRFPTHPPKRRRLPNRLLPPNPPRTLHCHPRRPTPSPCRPHRPLARQRPTNANPQPPRPRRRAPKPNSIRHHPTTQLTSPPEYPTLSPGRVSRGFLGYSWVFLSSFRCPTRRRCVSVLGFPAVVAPCL